MRGFLDLEVSYLRLLYNETEPSAKFDSSIPARLVGSGGDCLSAEIHPIAPMGRLAPLTTTLLMTFGSDWLADLKSQLKLACRQFCPMSLT
jgi:hypothetical protein